MSGQFRIAGNAVSAEHCQRRSEREAEQFMKRWREAVERALVPGLIAGASTSSVAALRGRHDSGSALASINATSHVLWGEGAARIKKPTLAHTVPGYLTNTAAAIFWTTVFEKLCGDLVDQRGAPAALLGAAMTSSIAYVTDYHVVPK